MRLRPYQRDCLKASLTDFRAGINTQLWNLPTGAGKTSCASRVPQLMQHKPWEQMVFLVPWDDLVWQAERAFKDANPELCIEVEKADHKASPDSDIIIGSIQSMGKKDRNGRYPRLEKFDPVSVRSVGVDEAHRITSQAHRAILKYFNVLRYEPGFDRSKLLFGITATANRHDGVGLEAFFEKISYAIPLKTLMTTGPMINGALYPYLSQPKVYRISTEIDASKMSKKGKDLSDVDMSHMLDTDQRNRMIVDAYRKYGEGMPGIGFTVDVKHSHRLAAAFNEHGIKAMAVSGDTTRKVLDAAYEAFKNRSLRILTSCAKIGEGTDLPAASVALMGCPTLSQPKYQQCLGRVLRPYPAPEQYLAMAEIGERPAWVKPYSIILDFCDLTGQHEIQTAPSLFGLPPKFNLKGKLAIEAEEEVSKLIQKQGGLNLQDCKDLEDVRMQVERVDCWRAPEVPTALKRISKYAWLETSPGVYRLALGFDSLEIRESMLGDFEVSHNQSGVKSVIFTSKSLKEALAEADGKVPASYSTFLRVKSGWRKDPPSEPQCKLLYRMESRVKDQFGSSDLFFAFASKRYRSGDMSFSKGGISQMLDRVSVTKGFGISA